MKKIALTILKVIRLFEYKKNNKKYWNKVKLYKYVVNKTLLIIKTFYLDYSLLSYLII